MLRILFGAAALALLATRALACDGQTGKVIFEDKFTDDSGGWAFGENFGFRFKAPGAAVLVKASDSGSDRSDFNQTFNATQGDFCVEMSFPAAAAQLEPEISLVFWAKDYSDFQAAHAYASGKIMLSKLLNRNWSTVWMEDTNNVVKTGPTDVNSVRAVVINGTITIIVNGKTVKKVRAEIPAGDLRFGLGAGRSKPSATPLWFPVRSYMVTAGE